MIDKVTFDQALSRLEEISELVRKKEVSLENSLDLLEESIQLAAICNQQVDYTAWLPQVEDGAPGQAEDESLGEDTVAE